MKRPYLTSVILLFCIIISITLLGYSTTFARWILQQTPLSYNKISGDFFSGIHIEDISYTNGTLNIAAQKLYCIITPLNAIRPHKHITKITTEGATLNGDTISVTGTFTLHGGVSLQVNSKQLHYPLEGLGNVYFSVDSHITGFSGFSSSVTITANIEVHKSILRPHFSRLSQRSLVDDPTITIVDKQDIPAKKISQQFHRLFTKNIRASISITAKEVWLKHPHAELLCEGAVQMNKNPGEAPHWTGKLTATQGYFQFKKRRFELRKGQLQLDALDAQNIFISLQTEYDQGDYVIVLQLDGPLSAIRHRLYAEPELNDAEIFSLLLFNKKPGHISAQEQTELQHEVITYLGSFLTNSITGGVQDFFSGSDFLFDFSGLDYADNSLNGSIGVGRYLGNGNNLFFYKAMDQQAVNKILLDLGLSKKIRLKSTISSEKEGSIEFMWGKEY